MEDGADKMGANLRRTMEKVRQLQDAVIFIDEFEELASCRDEADRLDKCITNEFLKQVPLFKNEPKRYAARVRHQLHWSFGPGVASAGTIRLYNSGWRPKRR